MILKSCSCEDENRWYQQLGTYHKRGMFSALSTRLLPNLLLIALTKGALLRVVARTCSIRYPKGDWYRASNPCGFNLTPVKRDFYEASFGYVCRQPWGIPRKCMTSISIHINCQSYSQKTNLELPPQLLFKTWLGIVQLSLLIAKDTFFLITLHNQKVILIYCLMVR